jgi:hypothetical membrane protein
MNSKSRQAQSALIAAILVVVPVVHIFSVIIASMNTPGYVTRLEPISNLALSSSPYRYLAIWGGLIVPGAALAGVSAWVLRSHLFGRQGEAGLAMAAVCGLGMVICGAFNYHSPVHMIAVVASACLSAPAIVLTALNHPAWSNRPAYKALCCLWALFPAADVFGTIYAMRHGRFLHPYVGLQQRLSVGGTICLFSIMILAAIYWPRHNNRGTTMGSAPDI